MEFVFLCFLSCSRYFKHFKITSSAIIVLWFCRQTQQSLGCNRRSNLRTVSLIGVGIIMVVMLVLPLLFFKKHLWQAPYFGRLDFAVYYFIYNSQCSVNRMMEELQGTLFMSCCLNLIVALLALIISHHDILHEKASSPWFPETKPKLPFMTL